MTAVLLIVSVFYAAWIMFLLRAWKRIEVDEPLPLVHTPGVSIVVAFRNEAQNLNALLTSVARQDYPAEALELLLVNDHSEDDYGTVLEAFNSYPFAWRIITLASGETGKKQAIRRATEEAAYEWILTTDADCFMGPQWVSGMVRHAQDSKASFVFGPVALTSDGSFLQEFQRMELAALVGSGAALWETGRPTMCNGANLLYRRALVAEDPYATNRQLASGDDEFLMHRVFLHQPASVSFAKNKETLVETAPCTSWSALWQQKIRWASKWEGYTLKHVQGIALGVFLVNAAYALLPVLAWWSPFLMPCILGVYAFRWIMDGIFIREMTRFYEKPFNLVRYVQIAGIYPWYVVFSGLAGRKKTYRWKGRTVS